MEMKEFPNKSRLDIDFTPLSHRHVNRKIGSIHRLLRIVLTLILIIASIFTANFFGFSYSDLQQWFTSVEPELSSLISSDESNFERFGNAILAKPSLDQDVYGIDVSEWQDVINWNLVAQDTTPHQFNFAFIKATEGNSIVDKYYQINWSESKNVGLLRGAYHYYDFSIDPLGQAQNFISQVSLDSTDFPPIVDIERMNNNLSASDSVRQKAIVDLEIMLKTLERQYSKLPIIYTNEAFYNTYFKGFLTRYPFWIAKYESEPPTNLGNTMALPNNPRIAIWQYSDSGTISGIRGNVDLNLIPSTAWTMLNISH